MNAGAKIADINAQRRSVMRALGATRKAVEPAGRGKRSYKRRAKHARGRWE